MTHALTRSTLRTARFAPLPILLSCALLTPSSPVHAGEAVGKNHTTKILLAVDGNDEVWRTAVRSLQRAGYEVADGSEAWSSTIKPLFFNLERSAPRGWPAALVGTWTGGILACRARAGKPPYTMRNKEAFLCGRELAPYLWQSFINHHQPTRVVVLEVAEDNRVGSPITFRISAQSYAPKGTIVSELQVSAMTSFKRSVATLVLGAARGGQGSPSKRFVPHRGPSVPLPDSAANMAGKVNLKVAPVTPPKACLDLPATVVFEPTRAPFAQTLSALWKRSVRTGAGELRCELRVFEGDGGALFADTQMMSVGSTITCPGLPPAHGRSFGISIAHAQPKLAQNSVRALYRSICGNDTTRANRPAPSK